MQPGRNASSKNHPVCFLLVVCKVPKWSASSLSQEGDLAPITVPKPAGGGKKKLNPAKLSNKLTPINEHVGFFICSICSLNLQ